VTHNPIMGADGRFHEANDWLPPAHPDNALSFDEVEAAGLDGTLRFGPQ
jgi:hypothetical protein